MKSRSPYEIIKHRHVTEKATTLESLKNNQSNKSVTRCESPKYVFVVDPKANKQEIKQAVEEIYAKQNVKVTSVNTINVKQKPTRQLRSRRGVGLKGSFKKAIVTLEPKDSLDNV